ncbi:NAD-dependent protein deacetylase [Rhodothermus profundi]|uniref:NAD-dependent protein deacetylase n=1 Tax=Rhodothermus profundi TaxID=633813 RepID=A0A1M6V670_9BACT|nr:NAD-dependent protein deacetylase [Rhodothermus profundi]SHK76962.1 NAD-dependent protein deacetylase, SIR2 family [Rhodothermus profundi]
MYPTSSTFQALVTHLRNRRIAVLTGAGCSTESGIPDYRGEGTRRRARRPIQYRTFLTDAAARAHYWARSTLGWPRLAKAQPNPGHYALAWLERAGLLTGLITQNVDRLHHKAGSRRVLELHGNLATVRCLTCKYTIPRAAFQQWLLNLNPGWTEQAAELAPDGDADLPRALTAHFRVPDCPRCGGILKPDVVFFGENVPRDRVEAARQIVAAAEALLVAGSSLAVYSGYRFVLEAARQAKPVVIVNLGPTRGDALATLRLEGRTGEVLPRLAAALIGQPVPEPPPPCPP